MGKYAIGEYFLRHTITIPTPKHWDSVSLHFTSKCSINASHYLHYALRSMTFTPCECAVLCIVHIVTTEREVYSNNVNVYRRIQSVAVARNKKKWNGKTIVKRWNQPEWGVFGIVIKIKRFHSPPHRLHRLDVDVASHMKSKILVRSRP